MMTIHTLCHCEEGTKVTDAAIHRVSHNAYDLSLRLLAHSGSPRASALAMTRVVRNEVCGSITACSLSLRGGNESDRRGNPSCPGGGGRLVSSLTGSQWIATGIRPRDDKSGGKRRRANFKKTRLFFLLGNNSVSRLP